MSSRPQADDEPTVNLQGRLLVARLPQVSRALSWAIVGGGFHETRAVAWLQVTARDLEPPVDPVDLLRRELAEHRLENAVGLLTSRRLDRHVVTCEQEAELAVWVVATVGLSNGVAAGDPGGYRPSQPKSEGFPAPGTINIHCHTSVALSDLALVETAALVSEARTAELLADPLLSPLSGLPITGTGTDCIVVTCPSPGLDGGEPYAGKHCAVGSLVGRAVRRAVGEGFRAWRDDRDRGILDSPETS